MRLGILAAILAVLAACSTASTSSQRPAPTPGIGDARAAFVAAIDPLNQALAAFSTGTSQGAALPQDQLTSQGKTLAAALENFQRSLKAQTWPASVATTISSLENDAYLLASDARNLSASSLTGLFVSDSRLLISDEHAVGTVLQVPGL